MNTGNVQLATLFADVVGSASLYQRLGDTKALAAIERGLNAMTEVVGAYGGRVIKTIGDELMVVFGSAPDAFHAACEMQWRIADLPEIDGERLEVRIGFHFGPAVDKGNDVFGESVNVAARLVKLARPGQVITSTRTVEVGGAQLAGRTRKLHSHALKGIGTEVIHECIWRDSDTMTTVFPEQVSRGSVWTGLELVHRGRKIVMGPDKPRVTFGRDPANDFTVSNNKASRVHAVIEWQPGKFVVTDQSTNGTWVTDDHGHEIPLRLEQMALQGKGVISLGGPLTDHPEDRIEFSGRTGS